MAPKLIDQNDDTLTIEHENGDQFKVPNTPENLSLVNSDVNRSNQEGAPRNAINMDADNEVPSASSLEPPSLLGQSATPDSSQQPASLDNQDNPQTPQMGPDQPLNQISQNGKESLPVLNVASGDTRGGVSPQQQPGINSPFGKVDMSKMNPINTATEGFDLERRGAGLQQEAQEARAKAASDAYDRSIKDTARTQAEMRKIQVDTDMHVQQRMAELDATNEQMKAVAAQKPGAWWTNASTGNKIMGAISIAFGALGGAVSGRGGNAAMDVINQAVNTEIEQQKSQLSALSSQEGLQNNMIHLYMQRGLDKMQAVQMAHAQALELTKMQIESASARAGTKEAEAQKDMLLGQINQRQSALIMPVMRSMYESQTIEQLRGDRGAVPMELTPLQMQDEKIAGKFVPGLGMAQTEKDADKAKTMIANHDSFMKELNDAILFTDKHGGKAGDYFSPSLSAKSRVMLNNLNSKFRQLNAEGTYHETENKFNEGILGTKLNPLWGYSKDAQIARLEELKSLMNQEKNSELSRMGFKVPNINQDKTVTLGKK